MSLGRNAPANLTGSKTLARIGILVVSDRASRGVYEDRSGKAISDFLEKVIQSNWIVILKIIPDGAECVASALIELSDREGCDLILTTGGTGPAPRDLTPEGTRMVIGRELMGFGELMRRVSLDHVPTAILSRQLAGIRNQSVIVNLPGSPKGAFSAATMAMPSALRVSSGSSTPSSQSSEVEYQALDSRL